MQMIDAFKAARRVATPLLRWSIVTGIVGLNEAGQAAAAQVTDGDAALITGNAGEALQWTPTVRQPAKQVFPVR